MKRWSVCLLISLILGLGLTTRVYRLGANPAGFFCDEASIGYNAYLLLKTGRDEYGKLLPFSFRSFGEYRNPVAIYTTAPFVAFLGLNEFSVRATAAFVGTLNILILYLLVKELFKKEGVALFSALFLAISPWHIQFSRFAVEQVHFTFWFTLSLWLFWRALRQEKFFLLSFLAFGVTFYTYKVAQIVLLPFLVGLFLIYRKEIAVKASKKIFWASLFLFGLFLLPFIWGLDSGTSLARWQMVSVFREGVSAESLRYVGQAYLAHFSLDFLFKTGDIDFPGHFIRRFSVRGLGELYWFQLPLLLLGLLSFSKFHQLKKSWAVLALWFALYPLGSSLTDTDGGGPLAFRSFFGVVPFQILSALGLIFLLEVIPHFASFAKHCLILIFLFIALGSFFSYLEKYHHEYPLYASGFGGWQYGPREVMKYFLSVSNRYDELFLMGNFNSPEIFIKFYDPKGLCQDRCQVGGLERLDFHKRQLWAIGFDRLGEIPPFYRLETQKIIPYPNGQPAFYLGEIKEYNF